MNLDYDLLIRPNKRWLAFEWRDFFAYRELFWQLIRRDFTARFKQTVLGPLWFILNPLVTTVIFTIIFGRVMGASPEGVPALLFFNAGLLGWNYFSNLLSSTGNTLQGNVHLFSKVYFPRLIVPVAQVVSNLFGLIIQLVTFGLLAVYVWITDSRFGNLHVGWPILLLPLLVIHTAILALGAGLLLSAITAKYRDLQNVLGFVINSLMFVTPVMWPLSKLQSKFPQHYEIFTLFNPMICIVEGFRVALLGVGSFSPTYYAMSLTSSVLILIIGTSLFQRASRSFVDYA